MSAPAWTSGEWKAGRYSSIVGVPITSQPDPTKNTVVIAGTMGAAGEDRRAECEANARLIAAAPDFADIAARAQYRANELGGDYSDLTMDELCSFMVEFDAALAKARGGL